MVSGTGRACGAGLIRAGGGGGRGGLMLEGARGEASHMGDMGESGQLTRA
jgi:hypothetical protein